MAELLARTENFIDAEKVKSAIIKVQEELEEHRDSINASTDEIQANYASVCELDNKIAKLNERIDDIYNILSKLSGKKLNKVPSFEDIDPLTSEEKNVFLNLYTESGPITYAELARKLKMSVELARQYILRLMEKGIPIQKTYKNTRPYIILNQKFKNLQAKQNILKIEQKILV